ncbi:MAG: hypothetical protein A3G34_02480 [Candidatus Lindowbacteria bacterium RIFCSPLOWO2_12_FULL_62_27]|nr:MAG: hypothetical protein A3G34_02480 [Candidatus Lindowbacteria bacterium RIFCSPLOWO2_12_FULL_62_27]OGH63671.1 MAG: hypothetical protein A3I06_04930 [Candidatus Lindowbacteria bacterium RIFCSPLOWO2_02_FULL_62_12]
MNQGKKLKGALREYGLLWTYYLLVLTVLIVASRPAMGASTGTTGAPFLKISVGSRPAAMGSAYTAVAEEPYALHYNPASIGHMDRWDLSAMHQDQFGEVSFDYFGLAAPAIKNRSGWGMSFVRMAVDDFSRTELDDGVKFTNADMALTATYAHRIFKPLSLGVSGKLIKQTLAQYTANGWAVDFGAHLKVNPRLSLGASIMNIGPDITFIAIGDPLPTTLRAGGALKLLPRGNLLATMDYWMPKDDAKGFGMGVEYRPSRFLAFRGGYQLGTSFRGFNASSFGLTFDFDNFGIEYAFVPREKLGDVHRAGLNVSFGGKKPEVIAQRKRDVRRKETVRRPQREPAVQSVSVRAEKAPAPSVPVAAPVAAPVEQEVPAWKSVLAESGEGTWAVAAQEERSAKESAPAEAPVSPAPAQEERPASASTEAIVQEKLSIASGLLRDQRYEEAVAIIRSGLKEDPRNVPLWYLLSESLYKIGEYDEAMEAVNRALTLIHSGRGGIAP